MTQGGAPSPPAQTASKSGAAAAPRQSPLPVQAERQKHHMLLAPRGMPLSKLKSPCALPADADTQMSFKSTPPANPRQYDVFTSRKCVQKTFQAAGGMAAVSRLALANARDLAPIIRWGRGGG